jgi:hypothetical protein
VYFTFKDQNNFTSSSSEGVNDFLPNTPIKLSDDDALSDMGTSCSDSVIYVRLLLFSTYVLLLLMLI